MRDFSLDITSLSRPESIICRAAVQPAAPGSDQTFYSVRWWNSELRGCRKVQTASLPLPLRSRHRRLR